MADIATPAPAGWAGVWGFVDGLGGAADRLGGIIDTAADAAEDVARGRGAIADQQQTKQSRDIDMMLQMRAFRRGDNRVQMLVIAAAAVALVLILK